METANTRYPVAPAKLVEILSEGGYSPTQVSQMLGGRISFRALYRWRNEEAMPQRYADYVDVLTLATGLGLFPRDGVEMGEGGDTGEIQEIRLTPAEPDIDDAETVWPDAESVDGDSDGEE